MAQVQAIRGGTSGVPSRHPFEVLPLGDHRGLAAASVRAWVGQTLAVRSVDLVRV